MSVTPHEVTGRYWERRRVWLKVRRRRSEARMWQRKRHRTQMLRVSNLHEPCSCGHRHWPCADPVCNDMYCGGSCRYYHRRLCPCVTYDPVYEVAA